MKSSKGLLILILSLSSQYVFSQFNYGFRIGLNLANERITNNGVKITFDNRPSLLAGGFVEWSISPTFKIQQEAIYTTNGDKATLNGFSYEDKLVYVEFPFLLKIAIVERIDIIGGGQWGKIVAAEAITNDPALNPGRSAGINTKEAYKTGNLSLIYGAEFHLNGAMDIGIRSVNGFTNILKDEISKPLGVDNRLNSLHFYLTFKFGH